MVRRFLTTAAFGLLAGLSLVPPTRAGTLVVNNSMSDPDSRKAVEAMVAEFELRNPDVHVQLNTMEHEAFKTAIRNWLTTKAPDVVFWGAGERLRTFVERGLIEDVSDVWTAEGLRSSMASSVSTVSTDGKQYAVPLSANGWGIYYRKGRARTRQRDAAQDLRRSGRGLQDAACARHRADHDRNQGALDHRGVVRLYRHAPEWAGLPRPTARRKGPVRRSQGAGGLQALEAAFGCAVLPGRPSRLHLPGGTADARYRARRDVSHRQLHRRRAAAGDSRQGGIGAISDNRTRCGRRGRRATRHRRDPCARPKTRPTQGASSHSPAKRTCRPG